MELREHKNCTLVRSTQGRIPPLPFCAVKEAILGKGYDLTLTFPTLELSRELHQTWKQQSDPVNVLAFPLDDQGGEIYITLSKARTEAPKFNHHYHEHVLFLFIHACLHLKGYDHGDTMEEQERHFMKRFVNTTT